LYHNVLAAIGTSIAEKPYQSSGVLSPTSWLFAASYQQALTAISKRGGACYTVLLCHFNWTLWLLSSDKN